MTDLRKAVQDAFYDALNVSTVTTIAPVYQHVPDGTQPPLVIIDDITQEPDGGKGGGLDRFTVVVVTVRRQPSRAALFELMDAVRSVLEGVGLTATGSILSSPTFDGGDDDLSDDGVTYIGTQRFSLWAQPA